MSKIETIKIFGERNSGTNYLENLLKVNIPGAEVNPKELGWKHGFINHKKIRAMNSDEILFITIFKDPYAWIASMHEKPHHAPQLFRMEFSDFIKSEWACFYGENYGKRDLVNDPLRDDEEMIHERNPITKERFKNVCELRTAKLRNFIKLRNSCKNYKNIIYEDLLKMPKRVVRHTINKFNLPSERESLENVDGYYGRDPKSKFKRKHYYLGKQYFAKYTQEDLDWVNQFLDHELEAKIGYEKVTNLSDIVLSQD